MTRTRRRALLGSCLVLACACRSPAPSTAAARSPEGVSAPHAPAAPAGAAASAPVAADSSAPLTVVAATLASSGDANHRVEVRVALFWDAKSQSVSRKI